MYGICRPFFVTIVLAFFKSDILCECFFNAMGFEATASTGAFQLYRLNLKQDKATNNYLNCRPTFIHLHLVIQYVNGLAKEDKASA